MNTKDSLCLGRRKIHVKTLCKPLSTRTTATVLNTPGLVCLTAHVRYQQTKEKTATDVYPRRSHIPESFRRLKCHEVVRTGDYVADVLLGGLKPREGLSGFRADTYRVTVYRKRNLRVAHK